MEWSRRLFLLGALDTKATELLHPTAPSHVGRRDDLQWTQSLFERCLILGVGYSTAMMIELWERELHHEAISPFRMKELRDVGSLQIVPQRDARKRQRLTQSHAFVEMRLARVIVHLDGRAWQLLECRRHQTEIG
jgi:hypothetical protein